MLPRRWGRGGEGGRCEGYVLGVGARRGGRGHSVEDRGAYLQVVPVSACLNRISRTVLTRWPGRYDYFALCADAITFVV